jgi:raffinose/stachyose/melibiose transport system permease protein
MKQTDSALPTPNSAGALTKTRVKGTCKWAVLRTWFYRRNQSGRLITLLIFLPPALMIFTLFVILPLFEASVFSVFKWNGIGELNNYVGPQNYQKVLGHRVFHDALGNTLNFD